MAQALFATPGFDGETVLGKPAMTRVEALAWHDLRPGAIDDRSKERCRRMTSGRT
jgi:hypothetical protein